MNTKETSFPHSLTVAALSLLFVLMAVLPASAQALSQKAAISQGVETKKQAVASTVHAAKTTIKQPTDSASRAEAEKALPTDLKASVLVVGPGNSTYNCWGHCALRLTCPSRGIDYFFTYGLYMSLENLAGFFAGTSKARFFVMKPHEYMQDYVNENRTMEEYRLNLSVEEIRRLWKLVDENTKESSARYFTLEDHCASEVLWKVEECLGSGSLVFGNLPEYKTFREFLSLKSNQRPWAGFWWKLLYGRQGDTSCSTEALLAPIVLVPVMRHSFIEEPDGSRRPLLADGGRPTVRYKARPDGPSTPGTLVDGRFVYEDQTAGMNFWTSPLGVFLVIFVLTAAVSFAQWRKQWRRLPHVVDVALLTVQSVVGAFLIYCVFFSNHKSFHGNVHVVIFNVVPLLVVAVTRFSPRFRASRLRSRLWLAMAVVCVLFAAAVPLSPQIELTYVLISLTFAMRCGVKGLCLITAERN